MSRIFASDWWWSFNIQYETQTMKMNFEQESSYFEVWDTHSFLLTLVESLIDTDPKFLSKTWFLGLIIVLKVREYVINCQFQLNNYHNHTGGPKF